MAEKSKNWDDRVLLKLKRKYSKDETVAMLIEKLKKVELELGYTKSERDELKYQNKDLNENLKRINTQFKKVNVLMKKVNEKNNKLNAIIREYQTEFNKSELVKNIRKQHGQAIKNKNEIIKRIRKDRDFLINKLNQKSK